MKLTAAVLTALLLAIPALAADKVEVVNTVDRPVPVALTGPATVTVTNTPAVTIANSPSVTVTNQPVVSLAAGGSVAIANTPDAPVPTRDADNAARNAFQAQVTLDWNGTNITSLAIPAGKRLVVDFVAISGEAASASGAIQPIVILGSTLTGGGSASYYLATQLLPNSNQQFAASNSVKVYADQLTVGLAFSGFAPYTMIFTISISGHLVTL